jgi:ATP-dependent RNA helicase DDX5/DBP2
MNRILQSTLLPLARQCGNKLLVQNETRYFINPFQLRRLMSTVEKEDDTVARYLEKHDIKVQGTNAPPPALSFEETKIPENILKMVLSQFDAPTPIQSQALPIAMEGSNMVGIGQTGSGKTLAFLLPALAHIQNSKSNRNNYAGPTALVLTPTRELAQQIEDVAREYRRSCNLGVIKCIGGESRIRQLRFYDNRPNLMIATPGRLNDFLQSQEMELSNVEYVVLDEADRMLDMGFEPQIRSILQKTKGEKQVLMFSATWPDDVKELAEDFLGEYTFLNIGSIELSANKNIKQEIIFCDQIDKMQTFLDKIDSLGDTKMLIFAETKRSVDFLERALRKRNIQAQGIHGDKSQIQRSSVIQKFKAGHCRIMIATDIAARGLDISGVEYVLNYDFPNDIENYVHRIGRTGRSNAKGTSITFFTDTDANQAKKLIEILKEAEQEIPQELYQYMKFARAEKFTKKRYGRQEGGVGAFGGYNNRQLYYLKCLTSRGR